MTRQGRVKSFAAAIAVWSLTTGSVAGAAVAPASPASPMVALSVFGTAQSQAAICAAGGSTAAATAATTAQAQGCVLPVTGTAPAAVVSQAPPTYVPATVEGGGVNFLPLLVGLGAIVAAYFLLDDALLGGGGGGIDIDVPISPA